MHRFRYTTYNITPILAGNEFSRISSPFATKLKVHNWRQYLFGLDFRKLNFFLLPQVLSSKLTDLRWYFITPSAANIKITVREEG